MAKQYKVFYRSPESKGWAQLDPGAHRAIYDVPAVHTVIQVLREHPEIEGVCVRHEDALFNLMVFEQPALAPNAFILHPAEDIS